MKLSPSILSAIAVAAFALPALASAAPGIPEQFYGSVTYGSGATPAGVVVIATVNGTAVASSTTNASGQYGIAPNLLIVPDANGTLSSADVTFTVGGVVVSQTAKFANATLTKRDLSVSGDAPGSQSQSTGGGGGSSSGSTSSSGGGGGGGGGYVAPTPVTSSVTSNPTPPTIVPSPVQASETSSSVGEVLGAQAYNFTKDLTLGDSGPDVTALQQMLLAEGYSIPAGATGYFGHQTLAASTAYQKANGIRPAVGYIGPITRASLNKGVIQSTPESTTASTGKPSGSKLTDAQVTAIISMLKAFGVDPVTIANVQAAL